MAIWIASEQEADAVSDLLVAFRDHLGYGTPPDREIQRVVAELVRDPNTDYLLAAPEPGDRPVGICQLRYRLCVWTAADDCWLEDLFVRDEARGTGLGRALVDAAFERARSRGVRRMDLDVNEENADAVAFYAHMGFSAEPKPPGRTFYIARRLD